MATHRITKSNQDCFILPWTSKFPAPYPAGYTRAILPPQSFGHMPRIQVVRLDGIERIGA